MHFIGMLALRLPFPTSYQLIWTLVSQIIAICSSFAAIILVSRGTLSLGRFILAGTFMGGGIASMHYVGMAAIESDYAIHYKLVPFVLSVLIAILVSYWALMLTLRAQNRNGARRREAGKWPGAALLGIAVSGMHYVGMTAAHFAEAPSSGPRANPTDNTVLLALTVEPGTLSLWVGVTVSVLIGLLIAGAFIDRRLAVESAQFSLLQFEALFNGNPDLVCALTLDGRLMQMNRAAEQISGYASEELLLRSARSLLAPERAEQLEVCFEKVREGDPQTFETVLVHKGGRAVHLSVTAIPVVSGSQVAAIMVIGKDRTMQKHNEEMMRKADKLSIAGRLAAGVAHEIRNPLTSVKGFLHLMRKGLGREDLYEVIDAEIDQIDGIITEFLLLASDQPARFKRTDLAELLGHVLSLVQAQANMSNIAIETRIDSGIPDVLCDENKIRQVFVNIIKNAIESMADKGTVKLEMTRKGDKDVLIRVSDEGGGLSDEVRSRLGEPYYRTKERGTGLGLMVSFNIVSEHNGTIDFKQAEGKGTMVEVTLPIG